MLRLDSALTAVPARGLQVSEAFITRQQRRDSELNIPELQITTHIDTADETVLSPMSNTDLFLLIQSIQHPSSRSLRQVVQALGCS